MADCNLFNFVLWGVVGSILCCFGFVGNLLSLVAFQRDRRSPTTTLLQCLASSDFVLLLSVFLTDALPYICEYTDTCANPWNTWPYIRYIWIITPVSHMCSIWFVVLIAFNRFWAVCQPHAMHIVWNNVKTPAYVGCVLALVISFNLPRFFEYQIVEVVSDDADNATDMILREIKTDFGSTWSYKVVYKVMLVNIVLVLLPLVGLIILTTLILRVLRHTKRRLESTKSTIAHAQNASSAQLAPVDNTGNDARKASVANHGASVVKANAAASKARAASEITFVLVTVVIVAIACQTPLAAFHFVRYTHRATCGQVVFYLDNISKLLVNINSCVNFLIYCFGSPRFRRLLLQTILCNAAGQVGPAGNNGGRDDRNQTQVNIQMDSRPR